MHCHSSVGQLMPRLPWLPGQGHLIQRHKIKSLRAIAGDDPVSSFDRSPAVALDVFRVSVVQQNDAAFALEAVDLGR
jgi:hypothetical protein